MAPRADASAWATAYAHQHEHEGHVEVSSPERDRRQREARRLMHVRRRRWLLWTPLLLVGAALLVWQVVSWEPSYWLVALGIALCLPWVGDV